MALKKEGPTLSLEKETLSPHITTSEYKQAVLCPGLRSFAVKPKGYCGPTGVTMSTIMNGYSRPCGWLTVAMHIYVIVIGASYLVDLYKGLSRRFENPQRRPRVED